MADLKFIETVTRDLIQAVSDSGTIAPQILKPLANYSDQELKSIRNCYRVMTARATQAHRGDDLLDQVLLAAEDTHDPILLQLLKRLLYIGRNDKETAMGLRGALHCLSYALKQK